MRTSLTPPDLEQIVRSMSQPANGVLSADRPLYYRIYRAIADEIASGRLQPGDRLPVERALCEQFGVSRATVRRALRALAEDGLLDSSLRRGSFVASGPLGEPPNVLLSFAAMAAARGYASSAKVLSQSVRPTTIDEADILMVAPGSGLFVLERLRLLEDMPVAIELSRISIVRAPGVDDVDYSTTSLYETLETRCGVTPTRADVTIEAVAADPAMAALLDVEPGTPLLLTNDTMFDRSGDPVSIDRTHFRSDRYRFRTSLHSRSGVPGGGSQRTVVH
jgi:GntR family transcriptional regulator